MFGTVDVKTRPLKLAYLVDPNSAVQVREAIRLSSTLWGGVYFPIIPLYRRMPVTWKDKPFKAPSAKDVILGYLEAFDPDSLVQFSREVPGFLADTGLRIIKPKEVWSILDEGRNLSPQFGIGIFEILNDAFDRHFKYTPKYPIRVILPKIPRTLSLFWASWLGELPPRIVSLLEERFFKPLEIEILNFTAENLSDTMAENVLFPGRIAQYGLSHHPHHPRSRGDAYVYFLDATKVEDIVDFWNLRALGRPIIPVPKQLQGDPQLKEIVVKFLRDHRRPWRHDPKVCDFARFIRGRNCTLEEMRDYAQTLKIDRRPYDPSNTPFFGLQHWYPRVWDEWARDKDGAVPDDIYGDTKESIEVKELEVRLKALLPKFAYEQSYHREPRCANEIGFRFFGTDQYLAEVFPKGSGRNLTRAISGIGSFREWRIGRNGLVKLVEHGFTEKRNAPTAESVFFAWLTDLGWKPQLSPPGLLAKEIYKRLQGNPVILKNETFLGLLERMNGGKVKQEVGALEVEQERELPVGEVKSRLEGSSEGSNPHDYLISRGVFKLGIRVQCPHCLRNSWFSLESLHDTLACPKCLNSYPAIGNVSAPDWSYKTVGPFSVPRYAEGAYAVLLTLEFVGGHKAPMMRTTPVMSFKAGASNKKDIEADVAMLWQESVDGGQIEGLLFGECKTYGVFGEKDFDRMRYLAEAFPGAVLVFSTLRKELTPREMAAIKRITKAGRKYWKPERPINPVLVLTGTELLSSGSPPYCWERSLQEKFSRVHGLLDICDATQQIYLGLPSWQTEWHDKWEKRRQRGQDREAGASKQVPPKSP
jgi:hypothetical protein